MFIRIQGYLHVYFKQGYLHVYLYTGSLICLFVYRVTYMFTYIKSHLCLFFARQLHWSK